MERLKPLGARRWAQDAIFSQSACNGSGLAHSLADLMHELCGEPHGTDWRNAHPCVVLLVTQLAYLANVASVAEPEPYSRAYAWCRAVADGTRADSWEYDASENRTVAA